MYSFFHDNWAEIIISIFSAILFYLVFEYIPRSRDKRNIRNQIAFHTENLFHHLHAIFRGCTNIKIDRNSLLDGDLTMKDFQTALAGLTFNTQLAWGRVLPEVREMTIGNSVLYDIKVFEREIELIFRYSHLLERKYMKLLSNILGNNLYQGWVFFINHRTIYTIGGLSYDITSASINHFATELLKLHKDYRDLESYMLNNFSEHPIFLRRKLFKYFNSKNNYNYSVVLASKLINTNYKWDGYLYLIRSYCKLNNYQSAYYYFDYCRKNNIIDANSLESWLVQDGVPQDKIEWLLT